MEAGHHCKFSYHFVSDGIEAQRYMRGSGDYGDRSRHPEPQLIVTDIKMPRCDGLELLDWIRKHYRGLPIVLLSSSDLDHDVREAYGLGANTFFMKPPRFNGLVRWAQHFTEYWCRDAELPCAD